MYKRNDKDNPFIMRKGETIVDLDRYVESLKENNILLLKSNTKKQKRIWVNRIK